MHYYFPGKHDVLTEALKHCVEHAFERQSHELRPISDAYQRLLKLIDMQLPKVGPVRDEWSVWLQFWAESAIRPELRPVHNEFYARWRDAVVRIIRRGLRQGVFRDVDADQVALRLTALTDGLAIQVLTGSPAVTVTVMRELLVDFARRELLGRSLGLTRRCGGAGWLTLGLDDQLGDAAVAQREPEPQIDDAAREIALQVVHDHVVLVVDAVGRGELAWCTVYSLAERAQPGADLVAGRGRSWPSSTTTASSV